MGQQTHIVFMNNVLMFDNWIKSGLIYINDILDQNWCITQQFIHVLDKIKNKSNWMSQYSMLKKAIPLKCQSLIWEEKSYKTELNIDRNVCTCIIRKSQSKLEDIDNATIYDTLLRKRT